MMIAMQRELMSALMDLLHKMWILFNVFPDQEERRMDVMLCQHIQHLRCVARMWAIVKGQCDLAA